MSCWISGSVCVGKAHLSYQSPIKMCNAHFNCDTVIGTRHIFAMLPLSSRKCNAGTALKTDWNEYFNRFSVSIITQAWKSGSYVFGCRVINIKGFAFGAFCIPASHKDSTASANQGHRETGTFLNYGSSVINHMKHRTVPSFKLQICAFYRMLSSENREIEGDGRSGLFPELP